MSDLSLYSTKAIVILDNDGNRIFAKYYQPPYASNTEQTPSLITSVKEQKQFEKALFSKTHRQNNDVLIFQNQLILYKTISDVTLYAIAANTEENESMIYQLVIGLKDAFAILLGNSVDKGSLLENYDLVALAIDEAVDSGIILETDPSSIAARTSKPLTSEPSINNIELSEQGLQNVFNFAKGKLAERLRQFQ